MEGCKVFLIVLLLLSLFNTWNCQGAGVNECASPEDIPCDDWNCISRAAWCDGEENCRDGSDEKYCKIHGWLARVDNHCTEKHFVCDNGMCIPASARCDSFFDCQDKQDSDERGCQELTTRRSSYSASSDEIRSPEPNIPVINNQNSLDNPDLGISTTRYTTATSPAIMSHSTTVNYYKKFRSESLNGNQRNIYNGYRNGMQQPNNNQPIGNSLNNYPDQRYSQRPYNYDGFSTQRHEQSHTPIYEPSPNCHNPPSPNTNSPYPWYTQRTTTEQPRPPRYPQRTTADQPRPPRYPQRTTTEQPRPPRYPQRTTTEQPRPPRYPQRSTTASLGFLVQRQLPTIIQPRILLNPPTPRQLYPYYARHESDHLPLHSFFFQKNFTQKYGHYYQREVDRAKQWLLGQRDTSAGWGRDTPRALVALSLIANSFTSDISDNDLMMKGFQTHLGMKLLRNKIEPMTPVRLASYINALFATCQNPRNFLELDLVDILYQQRKSVRPLNPFIYLTLCISGIAVDADEINQLGGLLLSRFPDEIMKDNHILATSALACFLQMMPHNFNLKRKVEDAAKSLIRAKLPNGSFGNIYSTALAAQALMSVNISENWDPRDMLDYIVGQQLEDGSFGDMMSTYYSVPALCGRSLLHLRNTQCKRAEKIVDDSWIYDILYPPGQIERKDILYTVSVGYPERSSISMPLNVPVGTTLLDAMRVAAYLNPRLKFEYKISYDNTDVHTISDIPNDPERGLHWNMYELLPSDRTVDLRQRSLKDIKKLKIVRDSEEFLFWYLPSV